MAPTRVAPAIALPTILRNLDQQREAALRGIASLSAAAEHRPLTLGEEVALETAWRDVERAEARRELLSHPPVTIAPAGVRP